MTKPDTKEIEKEIDALDNAIDSEPVSDGFKRMYTLCLDHVLDMCTAYDEAQKEIEAREKVCYNNMCYDCGVLDIIKSGHQLYCLFTRIQKELGEV